MSQLVLGLVLFLGVHSTRIVAPGWRAGLIERFGDGAWKGLYALASLAGLVLVGRGWTAAREPGGGGLEPLYAPVPGGVALALLLMPLLLILLVAGNLPAGRIRRFARHPMLVATVGWGVLHLLNNGASAAVLLFAAFAAWAALDIWSLLRRERIAAPRHAGAGPHGAPAPPEGAPLPWWPDAVAVIAGVALYAWFVAVGHEWLFGVSPLG